MHFTPVRHKGRTVYFASLGLRLHGCDLEHDLQLTLSEKGRSLRVWLNGKELTPEEGS